MKCCILSRSTRFVMVERSSDKIIQYSFEKYNLTPLDVYNEWSQVYCTKPISYSEPPKLRTTFSGPTFFWQKCWNRTFSMIVYLLIFYLFDDITKISESLMRIKLLRQRQFWQKCTCNLNVYIFYLRLALGIIVLTEKHQNYYFIQVKPPFSVVEFSNTVTFWRNARSDDILTSVTIINQVFLRKLFCYESLADIEVSEH